MISINEAKRLIKRALLANIVCDKPNLAITPLVSGKHGIGKSQMIKSIANDLGGVCITIEGGTLKEGEITGLPYQYKDENGNIRPYHLGHFFIAIDTDHFLGEQETRKKAGEIIRSVRASKKAPGHDHIFSAGEKEWNVWLERKDSGVPINESVQAEMNKVRDDLKLDYVFPWEK